MNKWKYYIIFILAPVRKVSFFFLLLVCYSVSAQTISFDIKVFGSVIGRMDVTRAHQTDGSDLYVIESNSKAKVLWINKTYWSKFEARYVDGKLVSSSHHETENGKTKRWAKISFDGKKYNVQSDKGQRSFTEVPVYSDVSLYFDDYRKIKRLFYLADADFDEVTHVDANTLEFKSTDGHRNIYFFENGKIKQMEFHLTLATVYMTRVN
ncbi:MAG: hypothetical protein KA149_08670 [Chitinophagales bacterium]|nr:hypothetical protein [Chitinophagales bacterium]